MVATPRDPTPAPSPADPKLQLEIAKLQLELATARAQAKPWRITWLQLSTLVIFFFASIALYNGVQTQRLRADLDRARERDGAHERVAKYLDWATSERSARERRAAGAYALGAEWGDAAWHDLMVPTLSELLSSDDHAVRVAAAGALARASSLRCDKPTPLVERLFGNADTLAVGTVVRKQLDLADAVGKERFTRDLARQHRLDLLESARQDTLAALRRGCLRNANLRGVDLRGADLRGAVLVGADLKDVDLGDADLAEADLSDVRNWTALRNLAGANIAGLAGAPEGFREWAKGRGASDDLDHDAWSQRKRQRPPAVVLGAPPPAVVRRAPGGR